MVGKGQALVEVHVVPEIGGIFGFPAEHPAHRADVVRLAALLTFGGIYLDLDVLVVRPFNGLMTRGFAAALELAPQGCPVGLCNAILLAEPDSAFARLCLEGHDPERSLWQGFRARGRDENYVEYSLRYPALLADLCPGLVDVLPPESFLWISWDEAGLRRLFEEDVRVPDGVHCLHLWESHSWERYLKPLTERAIREKDTTYHRLARPFLPEEPLRYAGPEGLDPLDFEPMDHLCREAGFVDPIRSDPVDFAGRMRKRLGAYRESWFVPLRWRLDRLEKRIDEIALQTDSVPTSPSLQYRDRSADLRFMMPAGASEPAVFVSGDARVAQGLSRALAEAPAGSVWVIADLDGADEQRARHLARRSGVRILHCPAEPVAFRRTLEAALPGQRLSLLATWGTGQEFDLWQAVADYRVGDVVTMANPVFPAEQALVARTSNVAHPSGAFWGASVAAFETLASRQFLALAAVSADSGFVHFSPKRPGGPGVEKIDRSPATVPVTSSYHQTLQLPVTAVREMLGEVHVEDLEAGTALKFRDCSGFPWASTNGSPAVS